MFGLFVAIIGFLLISMALHLMLKEIRREAEGKLKPDASFYDTIQRFDDEVERLRDEVDGMNESFYEVVDSLNDRLNDVKLKVDILHNTQIQKAKEKETEVMIDVTNSVRKSDVYHQYEMEDHISKNPGLVKEAPVFPEQGIRRKIIDLSKQGKSASGIAKEVDRGIGEVELILNLLGKR